MRARRLLLKTWRASSAVAMIDQWGSYGNNPLVVNKGMSIEQAKAQDDFGKSGGLVDGELIREFPVRLNSSKFQAA